MEMAAQVPQVRRRCCTWATTSKTKAKSHVSWLLPQTQKGLPSSWRLTTTSVGQWLHVWLCAWAQAWCLASQACSKAQK